MTTPRHRQQFDAARDPYGARNALGLTTWIAVDTAAPHAASDQPYYGGGYQLTAGTGVSFSVTNNPKRVTVNSTAAGGVSSVNGLTGALTIAAGTGINVASAGTTITISAPLFGTSAQGEVPASGGGTANFLRADGTWQIPPTGITGLLVGTTTIGGGTSGNYLYDNAGVLGERTPTQATATFDLFTSSLKGLTPSSGGGTTNFLRADGTWTAPVGTATTTPPACGRLDYSSATLLKFNPFNGDKIKINGVLYDIPASGISIANTSVNVGGTITNLAANTVYYLALYASGGVPTPIFWIAPQTHLPSTTAGNVGTEIVVSDAYSLIGLICTNASAQFSGINLTQVLILSWFNRKRRSLFYSVATNGASGPYTSLGPVLNFLIWGGEYVDVRTTCTFYGTAAAGHTFYLCAGLDGGTLGAGMGQTTYGNNLQFASAAEGATTPTETTHYATVMWGSTGANYNFTAAVTTEVWG